VRPWASDQYKGNEAALHRLHLTPPAISAKKLKKAGRIKSWHADKGYGFIDLHADLKDVFFHVTALQTRSVPPKPGDRVSFELVRGKDGRMQALNVTIAGAPKSAAGAGASGWPVLFGLAALATMVGGALGGYLPRQAGIVSVLASVMAFLAYVDDKARASRNARRTPEANLMSSLRLCTGTVGDATSRLPKLPTCAMGSNPLSGSCARL